LAAQERNEPERQAFRELIASLDARRLVVVDECASHLGMIPGYGRAPRGQRRWGKKRRNYGKNMSVVACMTLNGMGPSMIIEGAVDAAVFEAFVEHCLLPFLLPGQIVLMDNLSSHKGSRIEALIASRRCTILYLPAYSPDLTPIEEAFSKIKTFLKRASAQTVDTLLDAIAAALLTVSLSDAYGFFTMLAFFDRLNLHDNCCRAICDNGFYAITGRRLVQVWESAAMQVRLLVAAWAGSTQVALDPSCQRQAHHPQHPA